MVFVSILNFYGSALTQTYKYDIKYILRSLPTRELDMTRRMFDVRLESVPLESRRFLMQGFAIEAEFGGVIPWLRGLGETLYTLNPTSFVAQVQELTQQEEPLHAYQFAERGERGVYLGGLLHFTSHPERFHDPRNEALAEMLTEADVSFISCLQVRPPYRNLGIGETFMRKVLAQIHLKHGPVWGVVSNPRVIPWHLRTGATLLSPKENRDDLWIMRW